MYDSDLEYGPRRTRSGPQLRPVARRRTAHRPRPALRARHVAGGRCRDRRLAVQHEHHDSERAAVQRRIPGCRAGSRYRPEPSEPDRRSRWTEDPEQWFNAAAIGASGSAFGRPARGTFGDLPRNSLRGPGYWRTDASLFKNFALGAGRQIELRIEAVNLFNNVNLGNPDSEVGVPGNHEHQCRPDQLDGVLQRAIRSATCSSRSSSRSRLVDCHTGLRSSESERPRSRRRARSADGTARTTNM